MWPLLVVLLVPALDEQSSFSNREERPAIQAAVAQHAIERLVMPKGTSCLRQLIANDFAPANLDVRPSFSNPKNEKGDADRPPRGINTGH